MKRSVSTRVGAVLLWLVAIRAFDGGIDAAWEGAWPVAVGCIAFAAAIAAIGIDVWNAARFQDPQS